MPGEQEDGEGEILSLGKSRAEFGLVLTTLFPAAQSSLQGGLLPWSRRRQEAFPEKSLLGGVNWELGGGLMV